MFGKQTKQSAYNHVLVFTKPKFSRDKGIIRLCRNDPKHRFKLKTIHCIDYYLNKEQHEYEHTYTTRKDAIKSVYHGIVPIMYLSEWKSSSSDYKQYFAQSLCRGFPRLQIISHKGNLANLLNKYYARKCKDKLIANELFYPRTYVVPKDNDIFYIENPHFCNPSHSMSQDEREHLQDIKFIIKPQGKSKGNGISLVTKRSDIDFDEFVVIQKYIANPLLINDHKFDLRLYVLIASINPLQLYIYDKGLVRFASSVYSQSMVDNKENRSNKKRSTDRDILCSHLTNYTLNKKQASYKSKEKEIKWSLDQFWEFLKDKERERDLEHKEQEDGYLKTHIMQQVHEIIRTVFNIGYVKLNEGFSRSFRNADKNHGRCFDILGMDVLIDTNYKCWLMEFNRYPSLKCEHEIDRNIKYDLCNDLFKMLKPRIICNHVDNIIYHHKMPIILNPKDTHWKRVL